ncbi:MAG: hypothetical protein RLZZ393_438 [Pseudomonadota bacterium]|jgi:hypothetical protein
MASGGPAAVRRILLPMVVLLALPVAQVFAHGIVGGDARFVTASHGVQFAPWLYLGAKHMVTGYDHLLFLAGVIFYLFRLRDVAAYVTLFAVGHSSTLLLGVLADLRVDAHFVDALIGFSVVYKAFENLGGFRRIGWRLDSRAAVLLFGLAHGFGLATKLQELRPSQDGLVANMIGFNVGVEIGQFCALSLILIAFSLWRRSPSFLRTAWAANVLVMAAGFCLVGYQLTGYVLAGGFR